MKMLLLTFAACATASVSSAAIIQFDLLGKAGPGLIAGNENATILGTPGSGGELLGGFTFDNVAKVLSISFSWSGLQGASAGTFGMASGFHIHGPTTTPDPFLGNASVLHNISGGTAGGGAVPAYTVNNLATGSGSITGTISGIPAAQEADLLAGRWYVNVHSALNPGGEIRGNLVLVPEPAGALLGAAALGTLALRRRRD